MKKLSWILIIAGLLIAAYPLLDRAYSIYLQTKLIMDWDMDLENAYTPQEAVEDYGQLQSVFEDGLNGEADADTQEGSNGVDLEQTDISGEVSTGPVSTETAQPENHEATAKPVKQQQFVAIGRIKIEKIGVDIPILEGTSRANLRLGAGHIKGTSKLGSIGNAALAAHRSHTYGRMFNRLDELEVGDKIVVETAEGSYEYTVFKKLVVKPDDTSVLNRNDTDRVLTLITCTPLYTATHRLIVHAIIRN